MFSRLMPLALLASALLSCDGRYSPWETKVPSHLRDLTAKNLARVAALPPTELPIKIAAIADPQATPKDLETVVGILNKRDDLRLSLVLGDLTDYGLLNEYEWAAEALERSKIPVLTVVGNHDAIAHGQTIYKDMFGPYNYTFEDAGLKFIMWNNNQKEFGTQDFTWLQSQVDSRSVVSSHVPLVEDIHTQDQLNVWEGINRSAGIIASLAGHRGTKQDFLSYQNGIPYYIAPRVRGVRYSIITFHEDRSVSFQACHGEVCEEEKPQ